MRTIFYEADCGSHINRVIQEVVSISKKQKCFVRFSFNGVPFWASPNKSVDTLFWEWNNDERREVADFRRCREPRVRTGKLCFIC